MGQFHQLHEFIAQAERVIASGRAGQCSGVLQAHAASVAAITLELLGKGRHCRRKAQVIAGLGGLLADGPFDQFLVAFLS